MNLLRKLGRLLTIPFRRFKSLGERVISAIMMGGWNYGIYGGWAADRTEQVRHFRGWSYIAIRAICEEFALVDPHVAFIRRPEEIATRKARFRQELKAFGVRGREAKSRMHAYARRFLTQAQRQKALVHTQPHEEIELVDSDHPLFRLLRKPNPLDTGDLFFYELMLHLELTGNAYIWVIPNALGLPSEMWVLPSQWVRPHSGADSGRLVDWYDVRPSGVFGAAGVIQIPEEEVIHILYKNPQTKIDGYSPLSAGAEWIDVGDSISVSQFSQFKNRALHDLAIELDKEVYDPKNPDIERFKADFRAKYGGERNTGEPLVLTPGAKATVIGNSPIEMAYLESGDQNRDWQLALYRVSKSIAGIDDSMTFNSMVTSVANFLLRTMRPKRKMIGAVLTEKLARRYDENLILYWEDKAPDDPEMALKKRESDLDHGVTTVNECRVEDGKEPYPYGGDDPMLNMGISPMPWVTGEMQELDMEALNRLPQDDEEDGDGEESGKGKDDAEHEDGGDTNGKEDKARGPLFEIQNRIGRLRSMIIANGKHDN